jgi:hypothetical protein
MVEALGWAAFVVGLVGTLVLMADRGYHEGLRLAWFLATLAVPGWFTVIFRSISLDAVSGVAVGTFAAMLARPFHGVRTTWVLSDLLVLGIVVSGVISDATNRILIPGTVIELARTWVFPYVLGRLFLESWEDMNRTLPVVIVLAAALSIFGVIEAVSHMNILAKATGKSWDLLEKSEGFRWGLKRAQGTTNHPIYFGLLLALTLPWILMAARAAMRRAAPRWWIAVPALVVSAAIVTVSRSAQLAVLIVFAADLFFRRPSYRPVMTILFVVGAIVLAVFRQDIVDLLGAYAGERNIGEDMVLINGVEYEYTGTRHRDLLNIAYEEAIDNAGWFGFGTTLQDMPKDPNMAVQFESIDDHYLLQYLRYGTVGTAVFLLFALAGAWNLAREAWARDGPLSDLAAGLFGAFVAVIIMVRGVALSPDFGFAWLFVGGLAASMHARRVVAMTALSPPSYTETVPDGPAHRPKETA